MENLDLNNYIQQARKSGMGDDKIREGLLQLGSPIIDIEEALKEAPPDFVEQNRGSSIFRPRQNVGGKIGTTRMQKNIAIVGTIIILVLGTGYAYASYLAYKNYNEVARQAKIAQEEIKELEQKRAEDLIINQGAYRNDLFGFSIDLPESWKGYTVNHIKEDIRDITRETTTNNGAVDSFQIIELHHPQETAENPRENMPIMIFTAEQWAHIQKEEWAVGAAPIPPSLLGQNSQWIMALPARYNYAFKTGWEEVDELVHTLKAFEPVTDTSTWQTYTNVEYGFEFKYPGDWVLEEAGNIVIALKPVQEKEECFQLGFNCPIHMEAARNTNKISVKEFFGYDNLSYEREDHVLIDGVNSLKLINYWNEDVVFAESSTFSIRFSNFKDYSLESSISEVFNQILSTFRFLK